MRPPKNAKFPPISLILRWHESKRPDVVVVVVEGVVGPIICAGERSIFTRPLRLSIFGNVLNSDLFPLAILIFFSFSFVCLRNSSVFVKIFKIFLLSLPFFHYLNFCVTLQQFLSMFSSSFSETHTHTNFVSAFASKQLNIIRKKIKLNYISFADESQKKILPKNMLLASIFFFWCTSIGNRYFYFYFFSVYAKQIYFNCNIEIGREAKRKS